MAALIGLIGKKRAGKDTYAAALPGFTRVAFADKLKEMALLLDPLVVERETFSGDVRFVRLSELVRDYGWEKAKGVPEVRRNLQFLGMAVRELDQDFWIRQVAPQVDTLLATGNDVVITDVRFRNEGAFIHALGGKVVRIVRPNNDDGDTHTSETEMDSWRADLTVANNGTVEDLQEMAEHNARYFSLVHY